MRKNAKKFIDIKCNTCYNIIHKELKEYNSKIKEGKDKFYCNLSCAAKANKFLMSNAQYAKDNPKESIERLNSFPRKNKIKDEYSIFRYYIRKIKQRIKSLRFRGDLSKLEFNIDETFLKDLWEKQNGICPYTGIKMELPYNTQDENIKASIIKASLDRIDSSKGYIKGNVEFVCLGINYAKNGFSKNDVIEFINKIKK